MTTARKGQREGGQFFIPCPVRLTVDSKTSVGHHSYEACNQRSGGCPSHPVQSGWAKRWRTPPRRDHVAWPQM